MIKTLEGFPEPKPRIAPNRKYPWERWTDGAVYQATQGVEFTYSPHNFACALRARGRKEKMRVKTQYDSETLTMTFQFFPAESEE